MQIKHRWLREDKPGPKWAAAVEPTLPAYRRWYTSDDGHRPTLASCRRQLKRHMPELVPVWERLVALVGDDPQLAQLLTLWCPPTYLAACSQAVWTRGTPLLVRNYDYYVASTEGLFLSSAWTGTRVIAASDCLWGALDGMNEHGLCVALAYGGRMVRGAGFGIPLILRYVLETCRSTREALDVLRRIPSHMAYNVSVLDADAAHAVAQLGPDQATRILRSPVATNHQRVLQWPLNDQAARSLRRERFIEDQIRDASKTGADFCDAFLAPPVYAADHAEGHGTLYTAIYQPGTSTAEYRWPGKTVRQALDGFEEQELVIDYDA